MYIYDTDALLAVERGDRFLVRQHKRVNEEGHLPIVPAPVLAQAWRGGPQSRLSLLLKGCNGSALDNAAARSVGALLARAGTRDVVDASVVVAAIRNPGTTVVTSDPSDIRRIADAVDFRLVVIAV
jgi:predicted nucleic acid-binding protein